MDDIKLFAKMKKKCKTLYTVIIYSQDIRMEFSIEKFEILVMKAGKQHLTEENYTNLGICEDDTIKQVEMKDKIQKNISGELES